MTPDPPDLLRTFVALPLRDATRETLAAEAAHLERLDPRLRVVAPANYHLTLAFLGPTPAQDVPAIAQALADVALQAGAVGVRVKDLGAFPGPDRPRVLWAGLEELETLGALSALARAVGAALAGVGHAVGGERFHPHVTLARVREGVRPHRDLLAFLERPVLRRAHEPDSLSDLSLMVSETVAGGPRYRPLATHPLRPARAP